MRYGVIADLARRIAAGETIDVTMGYCNVIWQGDANAMAIASLANASSPPFVFNLAGPEELSIRATCEQLAGLMGRTVTFTGQEAADALLSNGARGWTHFGRPRVDAVTPDRVDRRLGLTRRHESRQADAFRVARRQILSASSDSSGRVI